MELLSAKLAELHARSLSSGEAVKVLDIGGWFAPCKQATHMVDIMPFETMNLPGAYGNGELKIRKENYHQMDLGALERLPFVDGEFDFIVCRHTLEDLKDPVRVCREMIRVGKAGYIETPSRLCESTKGIERHWWCGYYHHRWLIEVAGNKVIFQYKPHNIHFSRRYYFRCWPWQKPKKEYAHAQLLWEGAFEFEERIIIDYRDVKENLRAFKASMKGARPFGLRW